METEREREQLVKLKAKGTCGTFVVKDDQRLQKWKVALAQRYSNFEEENDADEGLGLQIKWEGDVDDPIIKLRDIKQKVPVVTIHLYKSKLKIMIQGSSISKWIEEEFPRLSELVNDTSTYDQIKW